MERSLSNKNKISCDWQVRSSQSRYAVINREIYSRHVVWGLVKSGLSVAMISQFLQRSETGGHIETRASPIFVCQPQSHFRLLQNMLNAIFPMKQTTFGL